ncbi:MAG: biopolymer transporter ExbD [Ignavibacteriae bacterium]|nr:biopolymer transporter ExbD [Ignavibacteriota bacterium]
MAGVDVGGGETRRHTKGKKKKKSRRVGIRIDMTPLVDIAFLLLTFFMLTTTMSRPQTMEINLPPEETKVEIAESNLLTLRVDSKGEIYWSIGIESPKKIEFAGLRTFLRDRAAANPKLVTLVKVDREGKYSMMVNLMDELKLAEISRFSLAPLLDQDKALLAKVKS